MPMNIPRFFLLPTRKINLIFDAFQNLIPVSIGCQLSDLSKVSKKIGKIIESAFITNSFDVTICLRKQFGSMVNSIFIEENSKGLICAFFKKSTKRLRRHKNYGRNVLQCNGFHKMIPNVIENGLEPLVLVWTTNKSVTFRIEDFFIFLFCQIVKDLDKSQ